MAVGDEIRQYAIARATDDVRETLQWLEANGYALVGQQGGPEESFGNVQLRYEGPDGVVVATRDRGQWVLEVARNPEAALVQYDLALAAAEHRDWRDYPHSLDVLPEQLPESVRWRHTLPTVLQWLQAAGDESDTAIARARDERYVFMWPDSRKAREAKRRWKAEDRA